MKSNVLDKNELLESPRGGTSVLKRCAHTDHGGIAAQISKPKMNWKEKLRKRKHKKLISKMEKLRDMEEISKYMVENLEKEMEMIKATVETNPPPNQSPQ